MKKTKKKSADKESLRGEQSGGGGSRAEEPRKKKNEREIGKKYKRKTAAVDCYLDWTVLCTPPTIPTPQSSLIHPPRPLFRPRFHPRRTLITQRKK